MRTSTRTRLGALVLGAALCAALVPSAAAAPAIPLNVGQETTGSDTGAHGFFAYEISDDQLCYTMSAMDLSVPAVAAHIHVGERKVAGPVVIPLDVGAGTTWSISDCVTVDPALLAAIEASPRDYYVNVHTPTFPGGEIRGHLK